MTHCWACDAELAPQWKFCIRCGVPVEADPAAVAAQQAGNTVIGPLGVFGLILAAVGGVLGVVVIIALVLRYT